MQTFEFAPYSIEFDRDPYPTYRYLRENAEVYYWPAGRAWVLSRYVDVEAALRDPQLSLSYRDWKFAQSDPNRLAFLALAEKGLTELSPDDHLRIRRLVSPAFSPAAVEQLRRQIQDIVDAVIGDLDGRTEFDVVADFANHIPHRLISELFCIPAAMSQLFVRFSNAIIQTTNPWLGQEEFAKIVGVIFEGVPEISGLIEERRKNLGSDLLSTLIRAEEQGDRLTSEELLALMCAMVAGAIEPTAHLIGFGALNLLRSPEQRWLLSAKPELIKNAMEEVLRFENSGKSSAPRFAREELEIRGHRIGKGEMIYPLLASALRDPDVFPNPDVFDIQRDLSRSIPFGSGPHRCLGAALGRIEGQVAVATLMKRFPGMRLAGEPVYAPHAYLRDMVSLKVAVGAQ